MTTQTCPRCGATLPPSATWEPLDLVDGRAPAYRNRHEKPGGEKGDRKCVIYSGEGQQEGATVGLRNNPQVYQ